MSDVEAVPVDGFVAQRSARRARPALERLHERNESVSLEWKNKVRERCALELRWKERPLALRQAVHDQRAAGRERKRDCGARILQGLARNYRQRRHILIGYSGGICDCRRKRDVVRESDQRLRESLEERDVRSHQNYFGHVRYSLLNQ